MPIIQESEMAHEYEDCISCGEYVGDIFLCGEGMICTSCFARESGCDETALYQKDEISKEDRERVRASLNYKLDLEGEDN